MGITAKELAKELNLSETAVSMALNNKPGVSTKTRQEVISLATKLGYDFSKVKNKASNKGSIYVVSYKANNAILAYSAIFEELIEGIKDKCLKENIKVKIIHFYEKTDSLEDFLSDLRVSDCVGIILIATEIEKEVCKKFLNLEYPTVLLDSSFNSIDASSVLINNVSASFMATDFLISQCKSQPGYLKSSIQIQNFKQRFEGYEKALRNCGMSPSRSIIHTLSPSIEDAMADMLAIIDNKDTLANAYIADNDIIAIGAIKALKLRNYKVPEDIAIIGFDNISEAKIIDPGLTTMDVPRFYIGQKAASALIEKLNNKFPFTSKIEISAKMIKRGSHARILSS